MSARRELEEWRTRALDATAENAVLRDLVVSMALGIPRTHLPTVERELLDDLVGPTPGGTSP